MCTATARRWSTNPIRRAAASAARFAERLRDTPEAWLTRRIEMIDTPGQTLSGWRLLMMMLEHEVHHRSQIDAYAGLEGWPVPDIFGRSPDVDPIAVAVDGYGVVPVEARAPFTTHKAMGRSIVIR